MKKFVIWLAVIAGIVLVIDWGVVGIKLLDGNYDITVGVYIGYISFVILLICILYIKFTNRCKHCGRLIQVYGKYCPYCGKEM